jgi:hypothetical protein
MLISHILFYFKKNPKKYKKPKKIKEKKYASAAD